MNFRPFLIMFLVIASVGCSENTAPKFVSPDTVVRLEQNWSAAMAEEFYHTAQGTQILPYSWFMALEQPVVSWNPMANVPLVADPEYLAQFGFLAGKKTPLNPDGLPVGFVRDENFVDPVTQQKSTQLGFTCALCHTGQLDIRNEQQQLVGLRIDGGAALINVQGFEDQLAEAVIFTEKVPFRFDRFAKRVLGEKYSDATRTELKAQFKEFIKPGIRETVLNKALHIYPVVSGYGRVDALNRIGNQVFGLQLDAANMAVADAPVAFPHVWEISWFDFVQYNGSIPNPLLRNIGEALGVKTPVVLTGAKEDLFKSSAHVHNLFLIEEWLAGQAPYQGLNSPQWPEQHLGAIDKEKAADGARLYAQHCMECHLPEKGVLQADLAADLPVYWTAKNSLHQPLLKLPMFDLAQIGTDPRQAEGFAERNVDTKGLGQGVMNAGAALYYVTIQVAERFFRDHNIGPDQQVEFANGHQLDAEQARVVKAYKARPLTGIWATPPFLHNGAVPTLYDLLSPVEERPMQFTLGSRLFDPVKVGYMVTAQPGFTPFDTQLPGNSRKGHEFTDGKGPGIIGPKLTEAERWQLVEYLKTL